MHCGLILASVWCVLCNYHCHPVVLSICGQWFVCAAITPCSQSRAEVVLRAGIINIVGNFGTVIVNQSYWQSAIAAKPSSTYSEYIFGGLCWFCIPFTLATSLGLASRALALPISLDEANAGPLLQCSPDTEKLPTETLKECVQYFFLLHSCHFTTCRTPLATRQTTMHMQCNASTTPTSPFPIPIKNHAKPKEEDPLQFFTWGLEKKPPRAASSKATNRKVVSTQRHDLVQTISAVVQVWYPPAVAVHIMSKGGAALVLIMLFMAVTFTRSGEQIAVSSLFSYDVYKEYINKNATGKDVRSFTHTKRLYSFF